MSVMLIDANRSGNLIQGICQFSQMWSCGSFFNLSRTGKPFEDDVKRFVKKLIQANLSTYNQKYEEDTIIPDIILSKGKPMGKHQTLKTLQFLHYNIELEYSPGSSELVKQLETMIEEIKNIIIGEIKEYKEAVWG